MPTQLFCTRLTQRDIRVTDSDIVSAPPQPPHTPAEQAALHPAVGILDSSRVSIHQRYRFHPGLRDSSRAEQGLSADMFMPQHYCQSGVKF